MRQRKGLKKFGVELVLQARTQARIRRECAHLEPDAYPLALLGADEGDDQRAGACVRFIVNTVVGWLGPDSGDRQRSGLKGIAMDS